ncbi:hypothetical protein RHGRI_026288 [Rhododendron griersonianum]|uniref:Uncharacterized protein n=1 Tax=Rhododendron griersonianum TaxID=479676 RepID=A0AAV6IYG4_9ERIC|nr:hypothetical protein RHGRI_026288 [Rhododendron griersonianum]
MAKVETELVGMKSLLTQMVNKVFGKETVSLQPVEVNLATKKKLDVTICIDTDESCLPFQPVEEVNVKSLVKKQPAQGLKRARTSEMTDLNTISAGVDVEIVDPIANRKKPRIKKPTKQLRRCSSRLAESDSFSQNGIGCPQTRPSNELKRSQYLCSPYILLDTKMKRMKGNKKATIRKVNMDEESDLDSDDIKCQKIGTALDLLCATFNGSSIPKKSLPLPKPIPPHPLSSDEKVLVAYCFDKELDRDLSFSETIVSFAIDLATRRDLCSLKLGVWLDSDIITLVVVQLTSVQRKRHQDRCHTTWASHYQMVYKGLRLLVDLGQFNFGVKFNVYLAKTSTRLFGEDVYEGPFVMHYVRMLCSKNLNCKWSTIPLETLKKSSAYITPLHFSQVSLIALSTPENYSLLHPLRLPH